MTIFSPNNYRVTKLGNKNKPLIMNISYKSVGKKEKNCKLLASS